MTNDKRMHLFLSLFLPAIFCLLMAACSDEEYMTGSSRQPQAMLSLDMQVSIPGQERPVTTRQMSPEDENRLETVHVLVFQADGKGDEKYLYTAGVIEKKTDLTGKNITQLKVNLRKSTSGEQYRLVLLANVPNFISPSEGMLKSDVLSGYVMGVPGKWDATEGSATIPMWGESSVTQINESTVLRDYYMGTAPIRLLRALCRVDVGLAFSGQAGEETVEGLPYFRLNSIAVYRSLNRVRIVPSVENLKNGMAVSPSLPAGNDMVRPADSPLIYNVENTNGYVREIYLPEAPAGTSGEDAACLVVGGYYGTGNSGKETFYRIDFLSPADAAGKQTSLPLLRNHRYKVNITKVSGEGFTTREDALNSAPANLETSVTVWDETSVSDVVYDGQYMLGVSRRQLDFYQDPSAQTLTVHTDYPGGWKAVVSEGGEWLVCSPASGIAGEDGRLTCSVSANDTGNERKGMITVSAGRMNWEIAVLQLPYSGVSLVLTDASGREITGMTFADREIAPQELQVKWSPAQAVVEVHRSGDAFDGEPLGDITGGSGLATFTLKPAEMNSGETGEFQSRSEIINFILKGDDGSVIAKTLVLEQKKYDVFPETPEGSSLLDDSGVYLMDGQPASFRIRANAPYRLRMVENEVDASAGGTPGRVIRENIDRHYGGKTNGETVSFTPYDDLTNPTRYIGHATFEITSTDMPEKFAPKRFRVMLASGIPQPESNAYMIKPGDKVGILIPVSRANTFADWKGADRPLGKDTPFEAHIAWSEKPEISNFSNIRLVRAAGQGEKGYILVLPGNTSGNTVVSATNTSGEILWSWHLWVSNYTPVAGQKWMDRNLGAMGNSQADATLAYGLLYQWGRKDPFPPQKSSVLYYGDTGERRDFLSTYQQTKQMTILESVRNPEKVVSHSQNWLVPAEESQFGKDLWGGGTVSQGSSASPTVKTIFDPCPAGWKVPSYGDESWGTVNFSLSSQSSPKGDMLYDKGGWYPITGSLTNGSAYDHLDEGYCWTSTSRSNISDSYYLVIRYIIKKHAVNNAAYHRATGMAIRCVRE